MARKDPDRVELEGVTATPMHDRGIDGEGRRYWRARTTDASRRTIWTGWGTRAEVSAAVGALVSKGLPGPQSGLGPARTVADLIRRWGAHQESRRKGNQIAARTLINYRQAGGYWIEDLGDVSVRSLSRLLVEDTLTGWLADGLAPRTCKFALDVLVAAVAWGAAREHCPAVDLSRISVVQVRDDEHVAVSSTPTRAQLAAVLSRLTGWYRDLLTIQALTGARIGEVSALHVRDWDREARTLE